MFALSKKKRSLKQIADELYQTAVREARAPVFYQTLGVPDTVDGRFEMITLHVFIVMQALKAQGYQGQVLLQPLFDVMFRDIERAGREMGIGDLSIPKQIKRMMEGFHGRALSYEQALSKNNNDLINVINRNVYGTVTRPDAAVLMAVSNYLKNNINHLKSQDILSGHIVFTPLVPGGETP